MRRRATLAVVWILGTAASMALAWTAVQAVGDEVSEQPTGAVAAATVPDPSTSTTGVPGSTTTTTAAAAPPGTTTAAPPSPGPTTAPAPAPVPTTAATAAPPPATRSQVFSVQGGSANVRCTGGDAGLVWATPAPGYVAEVHSGGPQVVEVRFESEDHESRLEVTCPGGAPSAQIREDGDGDGGSGSG